MAPSRLPYREDCWSEGATSTLVSAWGDRYVELNRGNLRQKHWQEVADAVNSRRVGVKKPPRTDAQCKNRIDTLKKKYKVEKGRVTSSSGALTSQWPFYSRLDALIGSKKPSPPLALPLPFHRKGSPLPAAAVAAAVRHVEEREKRRVEEVKSESSRELSEGDRIRKLARAIVRFGKIYERVEGAKQLQMMELKKERMEFIKGMEFQRMQIFMDSQAKIEKIMRAKRSDTGG